MGFSIAITVGKVNDTLTGRGGLASLSSIDTSAQINLTNTTPVTAYATGLTLAQTTYNGGVVYVTNQNGVFTLGNVTGLPTKLDGVVKLPYSLSATGQECASGVQVATLYVTLSSTALSATSAGVGLVDVTNSPVSVTSQVFCINTPVTNGAGTVVYPCQQDLSRMVQAILG